MHSISPLVWLSFGLLALAICAVWLKPVSLGGRLVVAPWLALFTAALIGGLAGGVLTPLAVAELALFGGVAYGAGSAAVGRGWRIVLLIVTGVLALALAMHRLPGFNNPQLIAGVRFSADATAFSQYANFDKAAVGLILLALLCRRAGQGADWRALARRSLPVAAGTVVVVMALGVALHVVGLAPKLPAYTPVFLLTNLLFTCVAEEAFFRGFLQERMAATSTGRVWQVGVVLLSGLLFGAAHLAGGPLYALLAGVAGVGYASAYALTRRVEAPILTHFCVNMAHFLLFTYPALAPLA
ncbi:CPBP family intramembrane glutamic endopeptidase [Rugamonas sp. CCM 8940]|uniref:CPBP family intramembrane glutamic endopeptidase n=1 Tax=Rugamonas sp. CCM 8940 TaxID=2765359 RepID=UPI0018F4135A|nr:CPBP family intramembrane glutamic endopeptidase [Rugamonas sp. CCM 8940]MBJ7310490.1 CPBP family intramembrane metalloprotease [Rugamonas sp. CCM 8940]